MSKTFLFQAIQFSQTVLIKTVQFCKSTVFVYTLLSVKTVLLQTIQFSIVMQFSSIYPKDRAPPDATTLGQNGLGCDCDEGVLHIPQISSITGTLPSNCLVSYTGHSLGRGLTTLQRCSRYILRPQPTGQLFILVYMYVCISVCEYLSIYLSIYL